VSGLVAVAILVLLAYGGASFFVYDSLGTAPGECDARDAANTPAQYSVRAGYDQAIADANRMPGPQEVRFASRDPQLPGDALAGWWIPAVAEDAPAVVVVHGIRSCRREANVLVPAGMLHRAGFSVFLMDLRDHGDSGGDDRRFSGGTEEHLDVLGAWDWVRAQGVPAERIGILGMSFGGITTLVAAGQERAIRATWTDSAAPRSGEAIGLFLEDQSGDPTGLSKLLVPGTVLWARIIAGDDLTRFDAIDGLATMSARYAAFVHGADDAALPATFATELHDAAVAAGATSPDAWIVPGAHHTEAVFVDPAGYEQRLLAFFCAALGAP
jgi:fermentation-respiration switch protein FrsA (DUF1100 family)